MEKQTNSSYQTPQSEVTSSYSMLWDDVGGEAELNDLYTNEYKLKKPIPIILKYLSEDRCFVAIVSNLSLWGEDTTLQGAERELATEIVNLYKRLTGLKISQLGPYPLELLSFLKKHIS